MGKRRQYTTHIPMPFGYKIAWFAVPVTDTATIAQAFGLRNPTPALWGEGVTEAYGDKVFITPSVGGWTLLPAWYWMSQLDSNPDQFVAPMLRSLSKIFGVVQFFASYRVSEFQLWAQAKKGKLVRGYCYLGERMETIWNEGEPTSAELEVGPFDEDNWPGEESVMKIAALWSVNPCIVDQLECEPGLGLLCLPPENV